MMASDDFMALASRVGRNHGPALLHDLWFAGKIGRGVLAEVLVPVWSLAEFPCRCLDRSLWIHWFRLASFPERSASVTLYRGAAPRFARGMSWTTQEHLARWFALRGGQPNRHVYTVVAPPAAILAHVGSIDPDGRNEGEVVVDPAALPRLRRAHTLDQKAPG